MYIAASTRSLCDLAFSAACLQLQDLGFDKVEIWLNEEFDHLKPSVVAQRPETQATLMRDASRITPVSLFLETETDLPTFTGIARFATILKIPQITIEASPKGTPFNTEIDRLRERNVICHREGLRLSILTRTGRLSEDPHTAVELCQSVKGLGITLDPSYFICRPGGPVDFDVVYPQVLHLQLRDTSRSEIQVPGGLGEVDYNHIISRLRNVGFQRMMSIDLLPGKMHGEERLLELRKLRLLLESLL